jgi:hypothetical protein
MKIDDLMDKKAEYVEGMFQAEGLINEEHYKSLIVLIDMKIARELRKGER